jgi:hypothetical protein
MVNPTPDHRHRPHEHGHIVGGAEEGGAVTRGCTTSWSLVRFSSGYSEHRNRKGEEKKKARRPQPLVGQALVGPVSTCRILKKNM